MKAKVNRGRLRELLLRRGLTQNDLARRLKISSGYCSQLANGVRFASGPVCQKLLDELHCEFDTLFTLIPNRDRATENSHAKINTIPC